MTRRTMPISKLFLWEKNPRFPEVKDEDAAIAVLLSNEKTDALAADISEYGLSPAESLLVFPLSPDDPDTNFVVVDGNRRLCALKLLTDPDRAPAAFRDRFHKLSEEWKHPVNSVEVSIVDVPEVRDHWLRRLHDGEQGGKGRRNWTTEQKARFSGGGRQKTAVDVLDRAERVGLISTGSRRGATSHMERLLRNPAVKEFLGIRKDPDTDAIQTTRHPDEFDKLLQHIVEEAQNKKLGSQATSAKIKDWINTLRAEIGPSDTYVDPYLITDPNTISPSARGSKIEGNTKGPANRIRKAIEIQKALQSYGNTKLRDLYRSICGVSLTEHPLLVSVGIWSFLDTLAANQGKSPQTAFNSYFSGEWMKANGLGGKNDAKGMSNALKNLCDGGNITKHDKVAAHYDSRQMANDMEVLTPLIVKALQKKATP
jgi:hypothetical protein